MTWDPIQLGHAAELISAIAELAQNHATQNHQPPRNQKTLPQLDFIDLVRFYSGKIGLGADNTDIHVTYKTFAPAIQRLGQFHFADLHLVETGSVL